MLKVSVKFSFRPIPRQSENKFFQNPNVTEQSFLSESLRNFQFVSFRPRIDSNSNSDWKSRIKSDKFSTYINQARLKNFFRIGSEWHGLALNDIQSETFAKETINSYSTEVCNVFFLNQNQNRLLLSLDEKIMIKNN